MPDGYGRSPSWATFAAGSSTPVMDEYLGYLLTGGASGATINFRDGNGGQIVDVVRLNPAQQWRRSKRRRILTPNGLYAEVTAGSATGYVRGNPMTTSDYVLLAPEVAYGDAANRETADVYGPRVQVGNRPVIFTFHGGAFVGGDKANLLGQTWSGNIVAAFATRLNAIVVNCNYPLSNYFANQNLFPTPETSVINCIAYFRAHAATYGINANKVALFGGSAGASYVLFAGSQLAGAAYLKTVIAASAGADYRLQVPRDVAGGETPGVYIARLKNGDATHAPNPHAWQTVMHLGQTSPDASYLNFHHAPPLDDDPAYQSVMNAASPVTVISAAETHTSHLTVGASESMPAIVVAQYAKARRDKPVPYTLHINGLRDATLNSALASLGMTLGVDFNEINAADANQAEQHADGLGFMDTLYIPWLTTALA